MFLLKPKVFEQNIHPIKFGKTSMCSFSVKVLTIFPYMEIRIPYKKKDKFQCHFSQKLHIEIC